MTIDEWDRQRAALFARLEIFYGPLPSRGALQIVEHQRREFATHTEIKLSYAGDGTERIPAYLLLPRNVPDGKRPGILAAHQCALTCDLGKEQVVGKCVDWPDQAYGLELVREGFVVLAPDANKVGERYDASLREQWRRAAGPAFRLPSNDRSCRFAWNPLKGAGPRNQLHA